MIRWIMIGLLSVGIVGLSIWGYQEHQEKNAVLIQAENTYQRAFHELSYHIDLLHDKIGSSLAMNSKERLSPQLVEIWRLTSEAHSNVGQLPLSLLPFNKTSAFLSEIGEFTYQTAVRDLENEPLSEEETHSLEELYRQSSEIKDELRQVQHVVLKNNLRWMDVQLALATLDEKDDDIILGAFRTVEDKVSGYSEANQDTALIGTATVEHEFIFLTENKINEKEALKRSRELFDLADDADISITKSGDGSEIPFYTVSHQDEDKNAYMDITEQGGHPITLLVDRPVESKEISLNEGLEQAKKYLEQFDYKGMEIYQSTQYDNIGMYSFLYNEDGIRVYSDSIEVKVALDDGDVLGFTAKNYLMNHHDRDIQKPEISEEEAKEKISQSLEIMEDHLAIIDNELGEEVLTYEYLALLDNETYRIFINAMNGKEERVEKLSGSEINYSGN